MEPPAASSSSPDPTPQDQSSSPSPAKRSAWKHPAPNGAGDAPAPGPAAVMDANHWPALSDAAKNTTKLTPTPTPTPAPDSTSSSSSPSPVAASSAMANSSNSHKHASGTHHARHHKPARRADHSPRDHADRTAAAAAWDHGAGATGGRGAQRNHSNAGGRRGGNGTTASATGVSHHSAAAGGGGFGGRRRGGYEPFYRGPPPMGGMGPYMRGAPPPPPPMTVPPPFMAPPPPPVSPMRPFAGPMVFHDMQSPVSPVSPIYFYGPPPPPEALRGLPLATPMVGPPAYPYFQAPSEPQPEPEPEPDVEGEERAKLLYQIEFYFSKENLCSDVYLRQKMDGQGWVDISLIAGFKKVQELTKDLQYIKQTVRSSSILEMQDDKIRKQNDWEKWVIPHESNPDIPSSSASVPRPNVNNLTAHLGGMGLHESASSSSTMEQNHHDVIQNGSTSGNDEAPVVDGNSSHQ